MLCTARIILTWSWLSQGWTRDFIFFLHRSFFFSLQSFFAASHYWLHCYSCSVSCLRFSVHLWSLCPSTLQWSSPPLPTPPNLPLVCFPDFHSFVIHCRVLFVSWQYWRPRPLLHDINLGRTTVPYLIYNSLPCEPKSHLHLHLDGIKVIGQTSNNLHTTLPVN